MTKAWIAVASAAHVRIGRAAGFMQVCHGKGGPLKRITPGDTVIYYSPTVSFGGKDKLRAFTAFGTVRERAPYQADMGGFVPWRRDVDWAEADETSVHPLLGTLSFTRGGQNWEYQLRFGLFDIPMADAGIIAQAMGVEETCERVAASL